MRFGIGRAHSDPSATFPFSVAASFFDIQPVDNFWDNFCPPLASVSSATGKTRQFPLR